MPSSLPPKGQKLDNQSLDPSDDEDEDLREQLDMHSIIVSSINEEPLFTAEQVTDSHCCFYLSTFCSCIKLFFVCKLELLFQPCPTNRLVDYCIVIFITIL